MNTKLIVEGMSCKHCAARVEKALKEVAGVKSAVVDLENKSADVEADDSTSLKDLAHAVTNAGYAVSAFE